MRRPTVGGIVAMGVAVVAATAWQLVAPEAAPTQIDVRPGADGWARMDDAACRVTGVFRASTLRTSGKGGVVPTNGEFLQLTVELTAAHATTRWLPATLVVDDKAYAEDAGTQHRPIGATDPGFVATESVIVEVPEGAWRGASLVLRPADDRDGLTPLRQVCVLPIPDDVPRIDAVAQAPREVRVDG